MPIKDNKFIAQPVTQLAVSLPHDDSQQIYPEIQLLFAFLQRAVLDFYESDLLIQKSAFLWILKHLDDDSPFSFNWTCEHLNISSQVKRMIVEMARRRAKEREMLIQEKAKKRKTTT